MCLTIKISHPKEEQAELYSLADITAKLFELFVPKVAETDIEVYKELCVKTKDNIKTFFGYHQTQFEYVLNESYEEEKFLKQDIENMAKSLYERFNRRLGDGGYRSYAGMGFGFGDIGHPVEMIVKEVMRRANLTEHTPTLDEKMQTVTNLDLNFGFHSYKTKKYNTFQTFIIPKGARYFEADGLYCSDKIIFKSE